VPPSAPGAPVSQVRGANRAANVGLAEALDHAAAPLEAALEAPVAEQSVDSLRTCCRAALARLRAIPR